MMGHREKVKLARRLLTRNERRIKGLPLFSSYGWGMRRAAIEKRVKRAEARAAQRRKVESAGRRGIGNVG